MTTHRPNFSRPPPDLIDREEKYKVECITNHHLYGKFRKLQYLIKWKGYPESDNTWEPADQVHTPDLIKLYHRHSPLKSIKGWQLCSQVQCPLGLIYPPLLGEKSWPKTPTTIINTTSPCSSITTLVLNTPPRSPPPHKKKLCVFKFIPSMIMSAPGQPLHFKHAKGIYQFLFHFKNKLSIQDCHDHAIQHWYFCKLHNCPYHC